MTAFDGSFVDRVNSEAKDIQFWRTVLTAVAAVLYGVGWLIGWLFKGTWLVITWCYAAGRVGFMDAFNRSPRDQRVDRRGRG